MKHIRRGIEIYSGYLQSHPLVTRAITTSVLISVSDVIAQELGYTSKPQFDWRRTLRGAAFGLLFTGPSLYLWWNIGLPRILGLSIFASATKTQKALLGVAIDQSMFSWWTVGGYLFWANYLQHLDFGRAAENVRHNILTSIYSAWTYWPFIMFFNLRFCPVMYQVLTVNFGSIGWNLYLSVRNHKGSTERKLE